MNKNVTTMIVAFLVLLLYQCGIGVFSCRTWLRKEVEPKVINGIVTTKSENGNCNGTLTIQQSDNSIFTLKLCNCLQYRQNWDSILEGDTILKDKNSVHLKIINGKKKVSFEYPCCDQ